MSHRVWLMILTPAIALAACSSSSTAEDSGVAPLPADSGFVPDAEPFVPDAEDPGPPDSGSLIGPVPAYTQREGDVDRGYHALVHEGYVGCGLPYSTYAATIGPAPVNLRLPNRDGNNATLPYDFNAFTTASGVEVVANNCLTCHASVLNGQLIIGLGDPNRDWTQDPSQFAEAAGFLINNPSERAEWRKWADRVSATAPYIQALTVGVNPADNLAPILFAHRDPATLAWFPTPMLEPPPTYVVPVDVPPWWRMKHKNAMFYVGGGRGDHARIMMTASVLCVDTVEEAQHIDTYFPDVRAYIYSLNAPPYPGMIDQNLANQGFEIFERMCARCHGTYPPNTSSFPNLIVDLDDVRTDATLAAGAIEIADRFRDWFESSFYGEISDLVPAPGYVAPPLEGIWATAPYLHNGSIPSLAAVLDSTQRPTYWTRSFNPNDYDYEGMMWRWTVVDHGQDAEPNLMRKRQIYDTTKTGYSNAGHTYGDQLTAADRTALLEYLKTL